MNDKIAEFLRSKLKIKITGKNIKRFISKLVYHKINLLNVNVINDKEAFITIYKNDLDKIEKIKSIYSLDILDSAGYIKIKKKLKINNFIIIFIFLGLISLFFLSNIIFSIEVIHYDKDIISFMKKELAHYGIKEKSFKKSFDELEKIKSTILHKYKDKLEWIEIQNIGTKYIIRIEERKIISTKENTDLQHIIATKNAIIKKVLATSGTVIKSKNTFVNKGDIVISGEIKLYDEIKNYTRAEGIIYGEVWYTVKTSYPFIYSEKKMTGKVKKRLLLKVFNNYYGLNFKKYDDAVLIDKELIYNPILPISFVYQEQKETIDNSFILTEEEANDKAILKSREKIKEKLDREEYIIYEKQLKKEVKNSKIVIEMFYAVYENITGYKSFDREE